MKSLINSEKNAVIRDRCLSIGPALEETIPLCMDRYDIVHIVKNVKVIYSFYFAIINEIVSLMP